jgi:phosphoribosylformimino-5-aminoimidazole carboxamide ribonucleotide (ProFAR) isomerase
MKLYPAIDILGGSAVRLVKGDFDAKKVYDDDPLSAARGWIEAGARQLHVVDLDGAKASAPVTWSTCGGSPSWVCRCSSAVDCALQTRWTMR